MTQGKRYAVLAFAILAAGALRMPFERQITDDLTKAGLLPPKLEQRTGEKIGQTFSAVSLGGLRTLVAPFMNLRAFTFFTEQRWGEVGDTYELIVDLAPRTRYYWDTYRRSMSGIRVYTDVGSKCLSVCDRFIN
jgi:hypothetical protein